MVRKQSVLNLMIKETSSSFLTLKLKKGGIKPPFFHLLFYPDVVLGNVTVSICIKGCLAVFIF